ncbi:hypothetical protein RYX45_07500 [Alkalihalophilus pseudofirmus]|uniref:Uncharacterized protein n=1 Tax=Alkalihalophilus pseudofirmus TaxID=79885 RepID=A0AAJ2NL52_ALKPS|nr:hypothetical protein [Alkalihalophilus pseudofirmus]MDV2885021.1 hypothetical protein [Alkalihalophilus pseudofirmus]
MGYFRVQPSSHCGCGPVAGTGFTKPEKKKKKEAAQCEGCFCKFAKKVGMGSFSRVIIDGVLYTTDFTEAILGPGVLVGGIQLVGCPKKKNCCVTFQITPLDAGALPDALLAILAALLPDIVDLEVVFPGGAPYFITVDCEKVSGFVFNGNGMGMMGV